jgi:hypothetical protein
VTTLTIAAFVAVAILVVSLTIWLVPRWQVQRWRSAGVTDEEKLAKLSLEARGSITQAFGGLALVATLAITAYQVSETRRSSEDTLRLAERAQLAERFSEAVQQLGATGAKGDPAIDVRTGALFSLRAIGLDSKDLADSAFFTVASYVTNNYVRPGLDELTHGCDKFGTPATDVSTAFRFVLPALSRELQANTGNGDVRGLRGARLAGLGFDELNFQRFDLSEIKLQLAYLNEPDFRESTLFKADLTMACLRKADLSDANLREAILVGTDLRNAKLEGANLRNANLKRADLRGADLSGAILTNADMEGAKLFESTVADADLSSEQRRAIAPVPD